MIKKILFSSTLLASAFAIITHAAADVYKSADFEDVFLHSKNFEGQMVEIQARVMIERGANSGIMQPAGIETDNLSFFLDEKTNPEAVDYLMGHKECRFGSETRGCKLFYARKSGVPRIFPNRHVHAY